MFQKLINISTNSFKRQNMPVMMHKVVTRIKESGTPTNDPVTAAQWAEEQSQSLDIFVKGLDAALWRKTQDTCADITAKAQSKLDTLGMDLGGGGHYILLYFLTRYFKPEVVVETGVAAGWSSQSILSAMKENGSNGILFSSDFPYFRYKNPEKYVGYVVDEGLKGHWRLFIDGDENNIPKILNEIKRPVDLFHYDSDKSYEGRNFAYDMIAPKLSDKALVIFDDIQDNMHFHDFVAEKQFEYKIFEFEGKYIGLTGPYFNNGNK